MSKGESEVGFRPGRGVPGVSESFVGQDAADSPFDISSFRYDRSLIIGGKRGVTTDSEYFIHLR